MSVRIITADVMEGLAQLPDESVHCVVTSPPYWGLRDYGMKGQIGLEPTPQAFVAHMVEVFREVRRVLRADGTCWLNLGDTYAGSGRGGNLGENTSTLEGSCSSQSASKHAAAVHAGVIGRRWVAPPMGFKSKDLMGMPWRVAFALQDDGWWLRRDVVWSKPNPMPESAEDRPTTSHEYLFLLTKSAHYFYDPHAIREGATYVGPNSPASQASPYGQGFTRRAREHRVGAKGNANGFRGGSYVGGTPGPRTVAGNSKVRGLTPRHEGHINHTGIDDTPRGLSRNKRSVWTMATVPFDGVFCTACKRFYDGADKKKIRVEVVASAAGGTKLKWCACGRNDAWLSHFATFPPELPETCILAGTSEKGCCPTCATPWGRVVRKPAEQGSWHDHAQDLAQGAGQGGTVRKRRWLESLSAARDTIGWEPSCECARAGAVPCTVLDPFGGAGTTGLVADRLGRDAILIELNPDYAAMAARRIAGDAPLLAEVGA